MRCYIALLFLAIIACHQFRCHCAGVATLASIRQPNLVSSIVHCHTTIALAEPMRTTTSCLSPWRCKSFPAQSEASMCYCFIWTGSECGRVLSQQHDTVCCYLWTLSKAMTCSQPMTSSVDRKQTFEIESLTATNWWGEKIILSLWTPDGTQGLWAKRLANRKKKDVFWALIKIQTEKCVCMNESATFTTHNGGATEWRFDLQHIACIIRS